MYKKCKASKRETNNRNKKRDLQLKIKESKKIIMIQKKIKHNKRNSD